MDAPCMALLLFDDRRVDELFSSATDRIGPDGSSWVKNRTVNSSTGSTQNSVLAAPPQPYSPALEVTFSGRGVDHNGEPEPESDPGFGRLADRVAELGQCPLRQADGCGSCRTTVARRGFGRHPSSP